MRLELYVRIAHLLSFVKFPSVNVGLCSSYFTLSYLSFVIQISQLDLRLHVACMDNTPNKLYLADFHLPNLGVNRWRFVALRVVAVSQATRAS